MEYMQKIKKKRISDGIRSKKIKKQAPVVHKEQHFSVKKTFEKDQNNVKKTLTFVPKNSILKKMFLWCKNHTFFLRVLFFVVGYFFILFTLFSYFDTTNMVIEPRIQKIKKQDVLTAFLNPQKNELSFDIIALNEKRSKKVFPKGKKQVQEHAQGIIKIFNNYSAEPQRLSPFTRFESVSGKVFTLGSEGVVVPGKKQNIPGEIEVRVYASKAGPDYNIDVTDFTLPGFKELNLLEKYNGIYGLSVKKFEGGFIGYHPSLDKDEEKSILEDLTKELRTLLLKRLEIEKTHKVLLVKDSIQLELGAYEIKESDGDNIEIIQHAKMFALLIEKEQLEKYLKKKYLSEISPENISISSFDKIYFSYRKKSPLDFKKIKQIVLHMDIDALFVWKIDKEKVKQELQEQLLKKSISVFKNHEGIQKAKIQVKPFWKKEISNFKKINISLLNSNK